MAGQETAVTTVFLLNQVLQNIRDQMLYIETEVLNAGSSAEIQELYNNVHEILLRTEKGQAALSAVEANKSISSKLDANSETLRKLIKLNDAFVELETEVPQFRGYSLLNDVYHYCS